MTDAGRFAPAVCDAFFAAVLVNDVVDAELPPPDALPLDHPADALAAGFALCRQVWAEGYDRPLLARVAWDALAGRGMPEAVAFKRVRAKFKQLRFAHALYGRAHRYPPWLDRTTILMGQLQDAVRHGQGARARGRAALLRVAASAPAARWLAREAGRLDADDPAGFRARLEADLARLGALLAGGRVTGRGFHDARKVVSRHNGFWTQMAVLRPCPRHHRLFRWLSAVNGEMGAFHDRLVAARAADPASYRAAFELPAPIAERIAALLALPRLSALPPPAPPAGDSRPPPATA